VTYSGTVTVNSDKTSGGNTMAISGTGAIWRPEPLSDASFGVVSNRFGFNVNWVSGRTVIVETATNLINPTWLPLQTNHLTGGPVYFHDPQWDSFKGRYYRIRAP
jgi:hypothetical protein